MENIWIKNNWSLLTEMFLGFSQEKVDSLKYKNLIFLKSLCRTSVNLRSYHGFVKNI